jgi:very-short-patch-repair endonuclease
MLITDYVVFIKFSKQILLFLNMAYIGRTIERDMYFGAKKDIILQARELRKDMTEAEEALWNRLRRKQINGFIFRRQHPIDIFIVDFYCHELKLVIEVDGGVHTNTEVAEYDIGREAEIEKFGLKIIRFTNNEVFNNSKSVIEKIKAHTAQ